MRDDDASDDATEGTASPCDDTECINTEGSYRLRVRARASSSRMGLVWISTNARVPPAIPVERMASVSTPKARTYASATKVRASMTRCACRRIRAIRVPCGVGSCSVKPTTATGATVLPAIAMTVAPASTSNECDVDTDPCGVGSCQNEAGTYACTCPGGYEFDGSTCVDADSCADQQSVWRRNVSGRRRRLQLRLCIWIWLRRRNLC